MNTRHRCNFQTLPNSKTSLTHLHESFTMTRMRTTLIINQEVPNLVRRLTGIQEKTALVRASLKASIAPEAAKDLGALGRAEPRLRSIPRRRHWTKR